MKIFGSSNLFRHFTFEYPFNWPRNSQNCTNPRMWRLINFFKCLTITTFYLWTKVPCFTFWGWWGCWKEFLRQVRRNICSTNLGVSAISMECVKNWNKSKNFPYFFFVHQMNLFIMNGGLLPKLVSYFL